MKRVFAIVLAALMLMTVFAGCDSKKEDELVMATNAAFPPYEYIEGNEIVGIDAEIAGAIAEKLGLELQIDDMDFDAAIWQFSRARAIFAWLVCP